MSVSRPTRDARLSSCRITPVAEIGEVLGDRERSGLIPRTTLRYAIERFPLAQRTTLLHATARPSRVGLVIPRRAGHTRVALLRPGHLQICCGPARPPHAGSSRSASKGRAFWPAVSAQRAPETKREKEGENDFRCRAFRYLLP